MVAISELPTRDRSLLARWIGERPETVIPVAALLEGRGNVWFSGSPARPSAVLAESHLVPGEPQGFGSGDALIDLLEAAHGWTCVEVDQTLAAAMNVEFNRRWTVARTVIDVVHRLDTPVDVHHHPLVRRLTPHEARELPTAHEDLLPDRNLVGAAAEAQRIFAGIDDGVIVGHGGSLACGRRCRCVRR